MTEYHIPVLLQEVIEFLQIQKGKKYIDATIGGGGHTFEMLQKGAVVLGIDCDQDAIDHIQEKLKEQQNKEELEKRFRLVQGNFRDIANIAHANEFENVQGILFDLGISSHQLKNEERGFSFQKTGPLDMRMDQNLQVRAKDLLNILTKGELHDLFTKLGEEHRARTISDNIIRARRIKPIETTTELALLIEDAYGMKRGARSDKARAAANMRAFQALRIAVNDELNTIREALPKAYNLLAKNGRLAVISFHSLEDRIVKNYFAHLQQEAKGEIITHKPIQATRQEIIANKRSRSAKLRVFEKK